MNKHDVNIICPQISERIVTLRENILRFSAAHIFPVYKAVAAFCHKHDFFSAADRLQSLSDIALRFSGIIGRCCVDERNPALHGRADRIKPVLI